MRDYINVITKTMQIVHKKKSTWGYLKLGNTLRIQGKDIVRTIYKDKKIIVMQDIISNKKHSYHLNDFIAGTFKFERV